MKNRRTVAFPAASAEAENAHTWLTVFQWPRESRFRTLLCGHSASRSTSQKRGRLGYRIRMESQDSGLHCRPADKCSLDRYRACLGAWGRKHCSRVTGTRLYGTGIAHRAPRCSKTLFQTRVCEVYRKLSVTEAVSTVRNYWVSCTLTQICQVLGHRRMLGMLMPWDVSSLGLTMIKRSDNGPMCLRTIGTGQWGNSDLA